MCPHLTLLQEHLGLRCCRIVSSGNVDDILQGLWCIRHSLHTLIYLTTICNAFFYINRSSGGFFSTLPSSTRDPAVSCWLGLYAPLVARLFFAIMIKTITPAIDIGHVRTLQSYPSTMYMSGISVAYMKFYQVST